MISTLPLIQGNTLTYHQSGQPAQLQVDTSDWSLNCKKHSVLADPYRGKGTHLLMRLLVPTAQAPLSSIQEPCPSLSPIGGLLVYSVRLV